MAILDGIDGAAQDCKVKSHPERMIASSTRPKDLTLLEKCRAMETIVMPCKVIDMKLDKLLGLSSSWEIHHRLQRRAEDLK